jgi:hypothetical protein
MQKTLPIYMQPLILELAVSKRRCTSRIQTFFYRIFDIAPLGQILLSREGVENVCAFAV